MEGKRRTMIWKSLQKIKKDLCVLESSLLVLEHAMKTGFHRWDVYEDAVYGLANQACSLQEAIVCLSGYLKEEGLREE